MDIDGLVQKLKEHNLDKYAAELSAKARPSIRLYLDKEDEDSIPLGASKIGGRPDLPASIKWPYETERPAPDARARFFNERPKYKELLPLSFIAQINLAEISHFDEENLLTRRGILYFFYSADQDVWGFDPRDHSGFKVLLFEGDTSELSREEFPVELDKYSRFAPCKLNIVPEVSLPTSFPFQPKFESDAEFDTYHAKIIDDGLVNKVLGYANPIQGDMELECELVANGLYAGTPEAYHDTRRKEFEEKSSEWRLLLQVDSNEDCGMMWGDVGRLYFWIRKNDLLEKRFDKCWMIYQCC